MSYNGGWHIRQVYLSGNRSDVIVNPTPKNLTWCRRMVAILTDDRDIGDCEYSIEPCGGWAALPDPLAVILYHVALGDVSPDIARAEILKLQTRCGDD